MKRDDFLGQVLQSVQQTAIESLKQGRIVGRREAFAEAAAVARNFDEAHRHVGELIAREIERHE